MAIRLGQRQAPAKAAPPVGAKATAPAQPEATRRAARARLVVGCMTGTSLDGLDVALVRIHGHGLAMQAEAVRAVGVPLGALAPRLRALAEQVPQTARDISALMADFSALHVIAIRELQAERIDLVVVHGQTVYHAPPLSWQLCAPAPISHALQAPVVFDLRAADLAAGGQGAPITPLADYVLFRHGSEARAVINLGGFCNVTRLPAGHDSTRLGGGDICACNQLLDALARRLWDAPYDDQGSVAAQGQVDRKALTGLTTALALQAKARRSLGTGDELGGWIERFRSRCPPADLARTACAAIAQTICAATAGAKRLVLAGGGARNRTLVQEFEQRAQVPVVTSDRLGVPIDAREAIGMAILGALCQDQVPITVPAITGVEAAPVSGSWCFPPQRAGAEAGRYPR